MNKILTIIIISLMPMLILAKDTTLSDKDKIYTQYIEVKEKINIGGSKKFPNGTLNVLGNNGKITTSYIDIKDIVKVGTEGNVDGRINVNGKIYTSDLIYSNNDIVAKNRVVVGNKEVSGTISVLGKRGRILSNFIEANTVNIGKVGRNNGRINVNGNLKVTGNIESASMDELKLQVKIQGNLIKDLQEKLVKAIKLINSK